MNRLSTIIKAACLGVCLFFVQNLDAQVVGEHALGIRWGLGTSPIGLSYQVVMTHHAAIEIYGGYNGDVAKALNVYTKGLTADSTGKIVKPKGLQKGGFIFGVNYQPFIYTGDRDKSTAFYANIGARIRTHNIRMTNDPIFKARNEFMKSIPGNKGGVITPEVLAGIGFQLELHEKFELFMDFNYIYYNDISYKWRGTVDGSFGARLRMN